MVRRSESTHLVLTRRLTLRYTLDVEAILLKCYAIVAVLSDFFAHCFWLTSVGRATVVAAECTVATRDFDGVY